MQAPWLIAASKGLNTPDLTFDSGVCEKSKSKVGPKKKYARPGLLLDQQSAAYTAYRLATLYCG